MAQTCQVAHESNRYIKENVATRNCVLQLWWMLVNDNKVNNKNYIKKEVHDDLSVCVLNILSKVSNLPNLLAINIVKAEK